MTENEISYQIRGAIFDVYNNLGPGLLESVYEEAMAYELAQRKLMFQRQVSVPIKYKGKILTSAMLRLDMIVEDKVIIELKSVKDLTSVNCKQLRTYLKLTDKKLGILVNFDTANLKESIIRVVNGL